MGKRTETVFFILELELVQSAWIRGSWLKVKPVIREEVGVWHFVCFVWFVVWLGVSACTLPDWLWSTERKREQPWLRFRVQLIYATMQKMWSHVWENTLFWLFGLFHGSWIVTTWASPDVMISQESYYPTVIVIKYHMAGSMKTFMWFREHDLASAALHQINL